MNIDNLDYSILKCVKDTDQTLWKKRIYQELSEHRDRYPLKDSASPQTIGRRVDDLENQKYLESTIISPDAVNRNLIIGYTITEAGKQILDEKRRVLLKRILSEELFGDDTTPIEKPALEQLIHNEFSAGLSTSQNYTRRQLLLLLAKHFVEQGMAEEFSVEQQQQFQELLTVE